MTVETKGTNLDTSGIENPDFRQLGDYIVERMGHYGVPGVAVGVLRDNEHFTAGFGVTSVEAPVPVDGETLFQIGSTSKTVTATAAMRLVEDGKLDLDAPVRSYLPSLRLQDEAVAGQVTLRHLFNHTGGWLGDYFDDTGMGDDALAIIVERMADLPQLTPLGQVWSYNNAGFYLAGRVIEVVADKPYETVIRELVFEPLGMDQSFFFAGDCISRRCAVGHIVSDGVATVARPWPLARSAHPAGGVSSTARDQLRYAQFHLGDGALLDGTRLLSAETMRMMQSATTPAGSGAGALGVTWMVKTIAGVKTVRHGGATLGQLSAFLMAPEQGFAITVLTNANRGGELHADVVQWALKHYLGVEEAELAPVEVSDEVLADYAGHYTTALTDFDLTVKDGSLVLQATPKGGFPDKGMKPQTPPPPPTRLRLGQDDCIVALDPPFKGGKGEFLRTAEGTIEWLRVGGRIARREG